MEAVGDQVVHRRQAGGPDVADPAHLQRGRLAGEDQEPLAGVAGQVEEDVDPVGADLLGERLIAECPAFAARCRTPPRSAWSGRRP